MDFTLNNALRQNRSMKILLTSLILFFSMNSYASDDFDSVVLGSSMAENFSAKEASELLGGTFVNISMAGSLLSERNIVLKHLFNKKVVSNVIISLDHSPYILYIVCTFIKPT